MPRPGGRPTWFGGAARRPPPTQRRVPPVATDRSTATSTETRRSTISSPRSTAPDEEEAGGHHARCRPAACPASPATGRDAADRRRARRLRPRAVAGASICTPRPYQEEAIAAWARHDGRGVVVLPTGAGKTVVALAIAARLGLRTLVVVPTIDLLAPVAAGARRPARLPAGGGRGRRRREARPCAI